MVGVDAPSLMAQASLHAKTWLMRATHRLRPLSLEMVAKVEIISTSRESWQEVDMNWRSLATLPSHTIESMFAEVAGHTSTAACLQTVRWGVRAQR